MADMIKQVKGRVSMKLKALFYGITALLMLLMSGCWDRIEVNDIALIMGSAFDKAPEGKLLVTLQVMLPSPTGVSGGAGGGGEKKKSFVVESYSGIEPGDALEKLQKKFSRKLFRGHRRVIIFGEEQAREGLDKILDSLSRDPQNRMRTHVLVSKGMKGRDVLMLEYPFERTPAEAMREMEVSGTGVEVTLRDFLMTASGQGIQPIAATIEPQEDKKGFQLTGTAVFNDLKLVGYLDGEETRGYLWIAGKLQRATVTATIPGNEGEISIDINIAKSKIRPEISGDKVRIYVDLKSEGVIHGNSTKLDFSIPKNISLAENAARETVTRRAKLTVKAAQEKFKSDIFGFGSYIYQSQPKEWEKIKEKWDEIFPQAEVIVSTDFIIRRTGMSGAPLHLKEDEVKK